MSNDKVEEQLLQLFDKLFQKQYLEKNIYVFNQMKPNLEIPVSVIYKQRKIIQVTSNESTILEALKKCNRVVVNQDGKTLKINIPLTKTKLSVEADKRIVERVPAFAEVTLFNGYRWEVDKNNVIIYGNDQTQISNLKALIEKQTGLACTIENSDPFFDLKDSIEKVKVLKKERTSYNNGYEGMQAGMWTNPGMFNFNPYAGKFQRPRGPGFIRKAVESDEQDNNQQINKKKQNQQKNKQQGKDKKDKQQHTKQKESPKQKKPKYRQKDAKQQKQLKSEIQKRTRLNSQNFPQIEQQIEKQVLKVKYNKSEIVGIYVNKAPNIPINAQLQKSGIPLLNLDGAFKLEAMKPGGRKESTFDTPKVIIVPRKSSTT